MRKFILATAVLATTSLTFATNGDNLIGLTPASRGMGGIGVGMPVGPVDSIFRNPAWMGVMENKFTVQFGGILFMPKVKGRQTMILDTPNNQPLIIDSGKKTSKADLFTVPEIGIVHRISERITFGLGAFGVSGMGVDYRNKTINLGNQTMPALSNMATTFQFMRIIPAIAVKINELITVSGAIHGAWGSLSLASQMCNFTDNDGDRLPEVAGCWNAGGGQSQTLGLGFQLGIALNFGDFLYAGATYQSPISMTYKRVFDSNGDGKFEDLKLTQPQEIAFGVGAAPLDNFKVGLDIRWINWSGADGYEDFQWDDQWVFAIGAEFKPTEKLALRVGYNYGESPIKGGEKNPQNQNSIPDFQRRFSDFEIAWFNLIGFPAIAEQHITLGVGYEFTDTVSVDFSYVRALETDERACAQGTNCGVSAYAEMVQDSVSVGITWKF